MKIEDISLDEFCRRCFNVSWFSLRDIPDAPKYIYYKKCDNTSVNKLNTFTGYIHTLSGESLNRGVSLHHKQAIISLTPIYTFIGGE